MTITVWVMVVMYLMKTLPPSKLLWEQVGHRATLTRPAQGGW